jgi:hypothetical protein
MLLPQGILEPNTTTAVQVMMQSQKEYPPDMSNCKDKFLVQTVQLLPGQDLEADTFKGDVSRAAALPHACLSNTPLSPATISMHRKQCALIASCYADAIAPALTAGGQGHEVESHSGGSTSPPLTCKSKQQLLPMCSTLPPAIAEL